MTGRTEPARQTAVSRLVPADLDDDELQRLTRLAAAVSGLPYITINILDAGCQRQLAAHGFAGGTSARDDSMCTWAVADGRTVAVADAREDPRWAANPWVDGRLAGVRAYVAAPLVLPTGEVLGTLCGFDEHPRAVRPDAVGLLEDLAVQVVAVLSARRLAREAAEHNELLAGLLQALDVAVVACDADGRLTLCNDTFRRWHGAEPDVAPGSLTTRYDLYGEDGRTLLPPGEAPLVRALAGQHVRDAELVLAPWGLPQTRVLVNSRAVHAPDGRRLGAVAAMSDVTALRQREVAVTRSEARFRATFEQGLTGVAVCDNGRVLQANGALAELLGRSTASLLGNRLPLDGGTALPAAGRGSVRLRRADGTVADAEVAVAAIPDASGRLLSLVQVEDVTERRAAESRLTHLATHDPLTGLANRALLLDRLRGALATAARDGSTTALLFVDLDDFKQVNDALGHEAGDRLLVHAARRLERAVRQGDTVARLGGDEFVVLCERIGGGSEAQEVADRLQQRLSRPVLLDGGAVRVGASVGVAMARPGDDAASLLSSADAAMYLVKQSAPAA